MQVENLGPESRFGPATMAKQKAAPTPSVQTHTSVPSIHRMPGQRRDDTEDSDDQKSRDFQVEGEHFPGVKYLDDDNDRSYPAYEKRACPRPRQIHISNMADLRREAARGEPVFEAVVCHIDTNGWAAGFDDIVKWLKWGRHGFNTPQDFDDWWFLGGIWEMVRDAAEVLARTPVPQDGFYGPDVAGTPWEATQAHLAASATEIQDRLQEQVDAESRATTNGC